jgi:hypothetical protein
MLVSKAAYKMSDITEPIGQPNIKESRYFASKHKPALDPICAEKTRQSSPTNNLFTFFGLLFIIL